MGGTYPSYVYGIVPIMILDDKSQGSGAIVVANSIWPIHSYTHKLKLSKKLKVIVLQ